MKKEKGRGQWSSNLGFIIASAGSAVGLGNLWKFPYVAGNNGGGGFLLIYLLLIILIGFTIVLAEMALGRYAKQSTVGAYQKLGGNWKYAGLLGVLSAYVILSYYGLLGGWVMEYIFTYLTGATQFAGQNIEASESFYQAFISSPVKPVIWQIIFMLSTILIVVKGIEGGIEKAGKIFMPALFFLFLVVMIRSITLPGASAGLSFFLKPKLTDITPGVFVSALGQVFFSLSLGMGINITYGSYLSKNSNLVVNSIAIPLIDTLVAVIAGLTILPAVFSFGLAPTQGPGLLFITLPTVFNNMPFGVFFGALFFFLVFFAAITSSVALLEVSASYLIDSFKMKRNQAVWLCGITVTMLGIPSALGFGVLSDVKIFGMSLFDFADFIPTNILLPAGGLLICIAVGYVWGTKNAAKEISNNGTLKFRLKTFWSFGIKILGPLAMLAIFANIIGIL